MTEDQLNLFVWADSRPAAQSLSTAQIIDLTPIIVRRMPDFDPRYPEPAKVIHPTFDRKRGAA